MRSVPSSKSQKPTKSLPDLETRVDLDPLISEENQVEEPKEAASQVSYTALATKVIYGLVAFTALVGTAILLSKSGFANSQTIVTQNSSLLPITNPEFLPIELGSSVDFQPDRRSFSTKGAKKPNDKGKGNNNKNKKTAASTSTTETSTTSTQEGTSTKSYSEQKSSPKSLPKNPKKPSTKGAKKPNNKNKKTAASTSTTETSTTSTQEPTSTRYFSDAEMDNYLKCLKYINDPTNPLNCDEVNNNPLPIGIAEQYRDRFVVNSNNEPEVPTTTIRVYSSQDIQNYLDCEQSTNSQNTPECTKILNDEGIREAVLDRVFQPSDQSLEGDEWERDDASDHAKAAVPINCILEDNIRRDNNGTIAPEEALVPQQYQHLCGPIVSEWKAGLAARRSKQEQPQS